MVKSIYLSSGRFAGADEPENWQSTLAELQKVVKNGEAIDFEPAELQRIAETKQILSGARPSDAWLAVIKLFAPVLLLIGAIWLLVWLLRTLV